MYIYIFIHFFQFIYIYDTMTTSNSFQVYNILLFHARGHSCAYTFYTLKDHPDTHVIMWRSKVSYRKRKSLDIYVFYVEYPRRM